MDNVSALLTSEEIRKIEEFIAVELGCNINLLQTSRIEIVGSKARIIVSNGRICPLKTIKTPHGCVISVQPKMSNETKQEVGNLTPLQIFSELGINRIRTLMKHFGSNTIHGPYVHLYCNRKLFNSKDTREVIRLLPNNNPLLKKWFSRSEYNHSFFGKQKIMMLFGIVVHDKLVSVCGVRRNSKDIYEVGVDTLEEYKGKGLAKKVVSAATQEILNVGRIPHYETKLENVSSLRVAKALGYVEYNQEISCIKRENKMRFLWHYFNTQLKPLSYYFEKPYF